jgi:hypothetical protein
MKDRNFWSSDEVFDNAALGERHTCSASRFRCIIRYSLKEYTTRTRYRRLQSMYLFFSASASAGLGSYTTTTGRGPKKATSKLPGHYAQYGVYYIM